MYISMGLGYKFVYIAAKEPHLSVAISSWIISIKATSPD